MRARPQPPVRDPRIRTLGSICILLCFAWIAGATSGWAAQQEAEPAVRKFEGGPGEVRFVMGRGDSIIAQRTIDLDAEVGLIVEFTEPPLLAGGLPGLPESQAMRFETDLVSIEARLARTRPTVYAPGRSRITHRYSRVFNGTAFQGTRRLAEEIRELSYVRRVHDDRPVEATLAESVPLINADDVWNDLGVRGEGVVIGIIDTGIDYLHPALGGGFGPGFKVVDGYDFVNDDSDPMDDHFHGTHVAGIAAGDGAQVVGVAPQASLVAYKVLNQNGFGSSSDIIAAIERSVDPDEDPLTDDALDVINLSLGGSGDPDDPKSQAIDNATAAGVVAVISAGNAGNYGTIGSPATARTAITVGASTKSDNLASFSSRGPNEKIFSIKPEIVAPGVSIVSSMPGGTTGSLNGTSMAAPHVAGVAALIRQLHPGWSPEMVKSAILHSGVDLGLDVFSQGTGRVDARAAADPAGLIVPGVVSFGLDDVSQSIWVGEETLSLMNLTDATRTYDLSVAGSLPSGITTSLSPSSVTIGPGESASIDFTISVDNSVVPFRNEPPFQYEGEVVATATGGAVSEGDDIRVPFAFIKSRVLVVTFDEEPGVFVVHDREGTAYWLNPSGTTIEVLLEAGTYDIIAYWGRTTRLIEEGVVVADRTQISINRSDASHFVEIKPIDELGQELVVDHGGDVTLHLASGYWIASIGLFSTGRFFSSVSDAYRWDWATGLIGIEKNYRFVGSMNGISGDTTLQNDPADLRRAFYRYDDGEERSTLSVRRWISRLSEARGFPVFFRFSLDSDEWTMSPPFHRESYSLPTPIPDHFWGWEFHEVFTDPTSRTTSGILESPYFSVDVGGAVVAQKFGPGLPVVYTTSLDTVELGQGPPRWNGALTNLSSFVKLSTALGRGKVFMSHVGDTYVGHYFPYELRQGATVIAADSISSTETSASPINRVVTPGTYTLEIWSHEYSVGSATGRATAVLEFGTTRADPDPPYLTEFFFQSGAAFRNVFEASEEKVVRFTLADDTGITTPVFQVRLLGGESWVDVPVTADGAGWTGELPQLLSGHYEARLMVADPAGNQLTYTMSPAFRLVGTLEAQLAIDDRNASLLDSLIVPMTLLSEESIARVDYEVVLDDALDILRYEGSDLTDRTVGFRHDVAWDSASATLTGALFEEGGAAIGGSDGAILQHRFSLPPSDSLRTRLSEADTSDVTRDVPSDPNQGLPSLAIVSPLRFTDFVVSNSVGDVLTTLGVDGRIELELLNTDVDFSGEVDIGDLVQMIDFVLERTAFTPMEFLVADAYVDAELNVIDVVRNVNIILGRPIGIGLLASRRPLMASEARKAEDGQHPVSFAVNTAAWQARSSGRSYEIAVTVPDKVVGLQFTLRHEPDRISLGEASLVLDERHYELVSKRSRGELTIIIYSPTGRSLPRGTHTLARVSVSERSGPATELEVVNSIAVDLAGRRIATEGDPLVDLSDELPREFSLGLNYPNPFTPQSGTRIELEVPAGYSAARDGPIKVDIYTIRGSLVRRLVDRPLRPGAHTLVWDGKNDRGALVNSGIYLLLARGPGFRERRRLVLIR